MTMNLHEVSDPLQVLFNECPPDLNLVKKIVPGELYVAVQLIDGNIGVSATLGSRFNADAGRLSAFDLSDQSHRIFLIAYYNAFFNPKIKVHQTGDIYDVVNFSGSSSVVMIGYFRPLVRKFDEAGIPLKIFDLKEDDERLMPISNLADHLGGAEQVILSSTSLVNRTFNDVINHVNMAANVYLLGPSTILHPLFRNYPVIKGLFGMYIPGDEERVLKVIAGNGGTPEFSAFTQKIVYLLDNE